MMPITKVARRETTPHIPMAVRLKMMLPIVIAALLKTMPHITVVTRWTTTPGNVKAV